MIGKLWPDSNCWCWGASCLSHAMWMRWSFTRPRASQKASAGFRSTPSQVFCLLLLFSKNHFHSRFGWPASPDLEQLPISRLAPQFLDKSCWHHQPSVISLILVIFFLILPNKHGGFLVIFSFYPHNMSQKCWIKSTAFRIIREFTRRRRRPQVRWPSGLSHVDRYGAHMGMDQYLLIPFLGGWTSIYQLFWCSPGVQGFDTLPYV